MSNLQMVEEVAKGRAQSRLTLFNARIDAAKGDPNFLEEVAKKSFSIVEADTNYVAQCGCNMVAGCGGRSEN